MNVSGLQLHMLWLCKDVDRAGNTNGTMLIWLSPVRTSAFPVVSVGFLSTSIESRGASHRNGTKRAPADVNLIQ